MLLYALGRLVGWSEPAVRTLPLLIDLLTIVLVYRTGNDFCSPSVGLTAALLLGGPSLLLVYVGVARAFTLVPFFATLAIRGYWRSALRPRAWPRRSDRILPGRARSFLQSLFWSAAASQRWVCTIYSSSNCHGAGGAPYC